MCSSTELVSHRDTDNTQGNVFVEAPSTWRNGSLQRLPERREKRAGAPGTRISRCRCPEAGMGVDVGGLVKQEGHAEKGEAGSNEISPGLGGQSRTVVIPDKRDGIGSKNTLVTVLSLTGHVRPRNCERGTWGMDGRSQLRGKRNSVCLGLVASMCHSLRPHFSPLALDLGGSQHLQQGPKRVYQFLHSPRLLASGGRGVWSC